MEYKVNVLTKCENEEETAVVIAAVLAAASEARYCRPDYNLVVRNIRRMPAGSPVWNRIGRHERFERKLNT